MSSAWWRRPQRSATAAGYDGARRDTFQLASGQKVLVGRSADCDLTIASANLSRRHLSLEVDDQGRVVVEDQGSANGVWIGGRRCSREAYASGVEIMLGGSVLKAPSKRSVATGPGSAG